MITTHSQKILQPSCPSDKDALALGAIQEAVANIRFGVVQIIIQDGKIVQIDKTEKIRLI